MGTRTEVQDHSLIPDFCNGRAVVTVVVIAAAVAFVLALSGYSGFHNLPRRLLTVFLYVQWIGLTSAAVMCLARRFLVGLSTLAAAGASLALLLATHMLIAEAAWQAAVFVGLAQNMIPDGHTSFLIRSAGLSLIISALVLHYVHLRRQWTRRVELAAEARVDALTARIRPHFLFNSMNTIAALTREDPRQAEAAVEDLSDLFRASLRSDRGMVTLRSEIELARMYERMESRRLGERLEVVWDVDELPGDVALPPLTLQPLLENAISHGVEQIAGGGRVSISGRVEDGQAVIEVDNPLPADGDGHKGEGVAIDNIRERLSLTVGGDAALELEPITGRYRVRLSLPLQRGGS